MLLLDFYLVNYLLKHITHASIFYLKSSGFFNSRNKCNISQAKSDREIKVNEVMDFSKQFMSVGKNVLANDELHCTKQLALALYKRAVCMAYPRDRKKAMATSKQAIEIPQPI